MLLAGASAVEIGAANLKIQIAAVNGMAQQTSQGLLQVDRVKSAFAERAFRHSATAVWNSLPKHLITDLSNFPTFKRHLKTELIVVHSFGDP